MNIKFPDNYKMCNYRDIHQGGLFLLDNSVFMKTNEASSVVMMETGEVFKIKETCRVVPISGTLVINEKKG